VVFAEMVGVLNVLPEPRLTPPVGLSHQLTVPVLEVAPKSTDPLPQREAGVEELMVGEALMVTVVLLE
jgi:hypothetical protein